MKSTLFLVLIAVSQCFLTKTQVDQKCFTDIIAVVNGVQTVVADVKASNWVQAEQDALAVLPLVKQAKTDCLSHPMKSINDACVADVQALIPAILKIGQDIAAKSWIAVVSDAEAFLPLVMKIKADCFASKNELLKALDQQCFEDVLAVVNGVKTIVADVKASNWVQAEQDALAVLPLVMKTKADCLAPSMKMINAACVTDVEALVPAIVKIGQDIAAKNWIAVVSDAEAFLPLVMKIKTDCFASKNELLKAIDARCIMDIVGVLEDVTAVVQDVESFNIAGAIAAVKAIVPAAEKAISDCGSSSKALTFNAACVTDVTGIIDDLGKIVLDVKDAKWAQVFEDASSIVKIGLSFKADCIDA